LNRLSRSRSWPDPLRADNSCRRDYDYDRVGNKTFETDPAGLRTDFQYDGLYRVKSKLLPEGPGGTVRYSEEYEYDRVGNRTLLRRRQRQVTTFEYDGLRRPKKTTRDPGGLNLVSVTEYNDPEGSHVNKSADHDLARGLRTVYTYGQDRA